MAGVRGLQLSPSAFVSFVKADSRDFPARGRRSDIRD